MRRPTTPNEIKVRGQFLRRLILGLIIAGLSPAAAAAQEGKCSLKMAQLPHSPELLGLHLGMTADEFKTLAPKIEPVKTDRFGSSAVNIFPAFEPRIDKKAFPDIRTVSLEFLDGRMSSLWIGYDSTFKWTEIEDFVPGITSSLGLPNNWEEKPRGRVMDCDDFQVTVAMIGQSPTIKLIDKEAKLRLEKRRAQWEASQQ